MTVTINLEEMARTLSIIEERLNSLSNVLPEDKIYKANFVCEEILTNLQRHADFEGKKAEVTLSLVLIENNALQLYFQDNAKAFDLLDFPDPVMSPNIDDREVGGLGIFLTKKYAKILEYTYSNGYNQLKVIL